MRTLHITPAPAMDTAVKTTIPLPRDMGTGYVQMLELGSGIRLSISDYTLNTTTLMAYNAFPAALGFGFCLSGRIDSRPEGFARPDTIQAGKSAVFNLGTGRMEEVVGTDRVVRLNIMLEPRECDGIFKNEENAFPPVIEKLFSFQGRRFTPLTPAMHSAVLQIIDCPLQGMARQLFLKGKVLELMALKLEPIESAAAPGRDRLKDEDLDRTRYAAQLLVQDLENPPDLSRLARQAGICQSKLHKCFRKVYGKTPFEYLRHKRMEKAEQLLRRGRMNVTQAAGLVGYSSLSHFSKAFKAFTGYLPGQIARTCQEDAYFR